MCIQNQNQLRGQMDNKVNKFKYLLLGKQSADMSHTLVQFFLQKKIFSFLLTALSPHSLSYRGHHRGVGCVSKNRNLGF